MKEKIFEVLSKPYKHKILDIKKELNLKTSTIEFYLEELIREERIVKIKDMYFLKSKGHFEYKNEEYGFITTDEKDYHLYLDSNNDLYDGDLVEFYIMPSNDERYLDEAKVIKVIERAKELFYGVLYLRDNKRSTYYYIIDEIGHKKIKVIGDNLSMYLHMIVEVKMIDYKEKSRTASFVRVVDKNDDKFSEFKLMSLKYDFPLEFSNETLEELKDIPDEVKIEDYKDRLDLTNLKAITIDGVSSKDFDDAVYLEKIEDGYRLYVLIADVSEYVKENTALNDDAYYKATSLYLSEFVNPMLPEKLSNGICSLNEGVNRLVLACIMDIDYSGNLVSYDIKEAIMKSAHRMTYDDVNLIFEHDEELISKYSDIYPMLTDMLTLSKIIRKRRYKKGAIDFNIPEFKAILDSKGDVDSIELVERKDAELMIEDFMLEANETVAYHMNLLELPSIYRIHEEPDYEKLENIYRFLYKDGVKIKMNRNMMSSKDIQKTLEIIKGKEYEFGLNQMILRAMAKAKYSKDNKGHFGLALKDYTHFTSPIRRYPDLILHRIIKRLLIHPINYEKDLIHFKEIMEDVCYHTSKKELDSISCERECEDYLSSLYLSKHLYNEYKGIISSITSFGMFVRLENGIEGLIHISNMHGYYEFDEKKLELSNDKFSYKIGDTVDIIVLSSNVVERKIDFILKKDYMVFTNE